MHWPFCILPAFSRSPSTLLSLKSPSFAPPLPMCPLQSCPLLPHRDPPLGLICWALPRLSPSSSLPLGGSSWLACSLPVHCSSDSHPPLSLGSTPCIDRLSVFLWDLCPALSYPPLLTYPIHGSGHQPLDSGSLAPAGLSCSISGHVAPWVSCSLFTSATGPLHLIPSAWSPCHQFFTQLQPSDDLAQLTAYISSQKGLSWSQSAPLFVKDHLLFFVVLLSYIAFIFG